MARKKIKAKTRRRIAKAKAKAKAAKAAGEEARQTCDADREEQEPSRHDEDASASGCIQIEPVFTIDETTGRSCASFALAIVNGRLVPVKLNPEEHRLHMIKNREIQKAQELVELIFETDMLSQYALPDIYVPHMQIEGHERKDFECVHKELSYCSLNLHEAELHLDKMKKFLDVFRSEYNAAGGVLNHNIRAAYHVTREEYADVWNSTIIMEWASLCFLREGTQYVLEGKNKAASHCASLAYCFEQHKSRNLLRKRLTMNWPKLNELYFDPDEHTLISFFKKRISCSCLDSKYQEVKSVKKLGICYNFKCPHPDRKVERSLTKCCSLCRRVNYCSRKCQVDNWKLHWLYCSGYVQRDLMVNSSSRGADSSIICSEISK